MKVKMARVLDIEIPDIQYLDENSDAPVGTVEFSHSKLFHPAIIAASEEPKPTPQEIAAANAFAKDFASRHGLIIAQEAHVGNIIPQFIDKKTGKPFTADYTNIPKSKISGSVPSYVKTLEWDDSANLPFFIDEQTGDIQHVPQGYFFLPRFNPNRGKVAEDLIAKK